MLKVSEGWFRRHTQMKPKISYRKRRDLMLKNYSSQKIILILGEEILRSGLLLVSKLGRPCEIKKEKYVISEKSKY